MAPPAARDFSLVIGGPFDNLLQQLRLPSHGLLNTEHRAAAFVVITWLPLLVLALAQGVAFGSLVRIPLLYDYSVYGRFLFGLPLLIIAEMAIDPALRRAICAFVDAGLVRETEMRPFEAALEKTARLRDARGQN